MRRLAILTVGIALVAGAASAATPRIHRFASYAARPIGAPCRLNRHRLTLCDARRGSARIASLGSTPFSVERCWITYGASSRAGCQIVTTWTFLLSSQPTVGRFVGPTRVWLAHRRICGAWVAFAGSVCF